MNKRQIIILWPCLILTLLFVECKSVWTGQKCDSYSHQLFDRSLDKDICNDYCLSEYQGTCKINNGYGECQCGTIWTGHKCDSYSHQLFDRSLNWNKCNDYCISEYQGACKINNGYGECECKVAQYRIKKPFGMLLQLLWGCGILL